MLNKIKTYIITHKVIAIIVVIALVATGIWTYKKLTSTTGETRYITGTVEKGTVVSSISGSGQVSASNQIDIKPKVSGDITYVGVVNGQAVKAGTLIAQINSSDVQKTIRDAQISLDSAKLSLQKLQLQNSSESLSADSAKAYEDGFAAVADVFLDLPTTMTALEDLLETNQLSNNSVNSKGKAATSYRSAAEISFYAAKKAFTKTRDDFRLLDHNATPVQIENIINTTYETNKLVADTIGKFKNLVDYLSEVSDADSASYTTYKSSLSTYATDINSNISNLYTAQNNINDNKDATPSAQLDLQSSMLTVEQRQNALQDAKEKLADYSIRAPFDGTITVVNVKKLDIASSSTAVATLITTNQIAEVSLNEVDVAKIKIGQKATLTFDAFDDLTISGQVIEVDAVGTVTQGVVSYNVKIGFDTQNENVKSGMTVNTTIVTDTHTDVLKIPASAVKTQNGQSYVQAFTPELTEKSPQGVTSTQRPKQIKVQVGISDDTHVEILSGLTEGQQIITRTISGTATTTTTTNSNTRGGAPRIF